MFCNFDYNTKKILYLLDGGPSGRSHIEPLAKAKNERGRRISEDSSPIEGGLLETSFSFHLCINLKK